jgi:ABC-2 type transport system permease protein
MRIAALIKRICRQMLRDKRTLALLFVAPLIILSLMYLLFNGQAAPPKLGLLNVAGPISEAFKGAHVTVVPYTDVADVKAAVVQDNLDGMLAINNGKLELTLQNSDPASAKALLMMLTQVASQALAQLPGFPAGSALGGSPGGGSGGGTGSSPGSPSGGPFGNLDVQYVYGSSDTVFFDVLSPILVGFFVFFFVFLISGIGLLKERTTGTLERLMATPIRRGEIVAAYLIGFGLFAVIQTVIVVFYAIQVLDLVLAGSIWNVLLVNLLLSLVALSLGILLSSFAASESRSRSFRKFSSPGSSRWTIWPNGCKR